ncbi:hypothetical protein GCM10020366_11510 [Saccharopolyspora gregorii]|uniref:Uncharacterized protein n=1 Tax=Saccharopolyspora gregorii TaxID=33914 RepID=A0ABP6RNM4_9PSEU
MRYKGQALMVVLLQRMSKRHQWHQPLLLRHQLLAQHLQRLQPHRHKAFFQPWD